MRTDDEIIARIVAVKDDDWIGTQRGELIRRLPLDAAREFLTKEADVADWKPLPRDRDYVLMELVDYMSYAWDKANNRRGLSAGRSLDHMTSWLWLMAEDKFLAAMHMRDYSHYGKSQLRAICERFNVDWRELDDGRWANDDYDGGVPASMVSEINA